MDAFWIILTGTLTASASGLLGCYLLLRKLSLLGDAISHAVLPGIFLAYWLSGTRASGYMLVGAALFGMLCAWLIELMQQKARLQSDAATGAVFTFLFAVGVILISAFSGQVDLDQDCILYGEIAYVPLDTWISANGTNLGPIAVWQMGFTFLLVLVMIIVGYRGLLVSTFDAEYAQTLGISTAFWHYLLTGAVSLNTVVAFNSIGAVLTSAFLVVPAATAYLLTRKLHIMLLLSVVVGFLAAISGYYLASIVDGSIGGAMTVALGGWFLLALAAYLLKTRFVSAIPMQIELSDSK